MMMGGINFLFIDFSSIKLYIKIRILKKEKLFSFLIDACYLFFKYQMWGIPLRLYIPIFPSFFQNYQTISQGLYFAVRLIESSTILAESITLFPTLSQM